MDEGPNKEHTQDLKQILENIKTELASIKNELREDLRTELDGIRKELKAEIDKSKTREGTAKSTIQTPTPAATIDIPSDEPSARESGKRTEEYDIKDFNAVEAGGAFEIQIVRSDSYSVTVTAEENLFRNLEVGKEGDTLRLRHSKHLSWRAQLTRPRVRVTMPLLKELHLSGASKGTITGFNSSEKFELKMSGASSLSGDITAGAADIDMSGASRGTLTGSATDAVIEASGANNMDMRGFSIHNGAVRLSGASHLTLNADGKLDARLSGVSSLDVSGNPVMGNIRTSGASRLTKE